MKAGNSNTEALIILAVLIIVVIINATSSPNTANKQRSTLGYFTATETHGENIVASRPPSALSISLSTGNAPYVYQPYDEYINIYNNGQEAVDITHWQLRNAKDKRTYDVGGALRRFGADTATIGQGVSFIPASGSPHFQNIVLAPGDEAIVTTGSIGPFTPYKIVSFKENKCSGYLDELPEYSFTPALSHSCPRPADEIGVNNLDSECRRFIEQIPSCRTPLFETRDSDGNICHNCVDKKLLSSSCVTFIKQRLNYGSCIAYHSLDPNFSSRKWRIFLAKGWEMWANRYETINLLDQEGRLIKSASY
jgi:hypothetical protein